MSELIRPPDREGKSKGHQRNGTESKILACARKFKINSLKEHVVSRKFTKLARNFTEFHSRQEARRSQKAAQGSTEPAQDGDSTSPETAVSRTTAGTRRLPARSNTNQAIARRQTPTPTLIQAGIIIPTMTYHPSIMPMFYFALLNNGQFLGLKCGMTIPQKSNPPLPETPPTLQPTLLQLTTVH